MYGFDWFAEWDTSLNSCIGRAALENPTCFSLCPRIALKGYSLNCKPSVSRQSLNSYKYVWGQNS